MKNPIWIIIDGGSTFEGHQGQYADCFFTNAYLGAIEIQVAHSEVFEGSTLEIREMSDAEVLKYPEAVVFSDWLIQNYGEC